MQGYTTDIINLIQDNLRDRYQSGFPILKELIQNADDAKNVSRFIFGYHYGFAESLHPLLRGQGLFFFNNGDFSKTDKKAIASFASNSKAGESDSIGKFGLGMKSVFHLCEAFFYLAWEGESRYSEALNPWKVSEDDNIHSDWNIVEESDWQLLRQLAESVSENEKKGFFLWIPLRKKIHLYNQGSPTGSIMDIFPGDDGSLGQELSFLFDITLKSTLLSLLPLLRNLKSIEFKPLDEEYKFKLDLTCSVDPDIDAHGCRVSGEVSGDGFPLVYYGIKHESSLPLFNSIRENDKWPKSYYLDTSGFRQLAKDKSKPEGSVIISHQDNQTGKLTIQWALFLPLEEESHIYRSRITNSNRHIRIYIHGQFFVDAGRRGIHEFKQLGEKSLDSSSEIDETSLRRHWNQMVAQQVSLPLVLVALDDYIRKHSFTDQEIVGLTLALVEAVSEGRDSLCRTFKKSICSSNAWVRQLLRNGSKWQLVETKNCRLLPLPAPRNSKAPDRPWLVFPLLNKLEASCSFYDASAPAIIADSVQWTEDEINKMIESVDAKVISESTSLDYLTDFIETVAKYCVNTEKIQKTLLSLVINGFRSASLSELRQNRQKVIKLVKYILPQSRLPIGTVDFRFI